MKKFFIFLILFPFLGFAQTNPKQNDAYKGVATGTNSYSVTIGGTNNPDAPFLGQTIKVKAANTNSGASTLRVSTATTNYPVKTITNGGAALTGGEIVAGVWNIFVYDTASSGQWQLNGSAGGSGGAGTVTSMTVTTANGVSGTVANPTTTPALTLSVTTVSGNLFTTGTGTVTASGATSISGVNTGDQTTISGNAGSATSLNVTNNNSSTSPVYLGWFPGTSGNQTAGVSSTKVKMIPQYGYTGINCTPNRDFEIRRDTNYSADLYVTNRSLGALSQSRVLVGGIVNFPGDDTARYIQMVYNGPNHGISLYRNTGVLTWGGTLDHGKVFNDCPGPLIFSSRRNTGVTATDFESPDIVLTPGYTGAITNTGAPILFGTATTNTVVASKVQVSGKQYISDALIIGNPTAVSQNEKLRIDQDLTGAAIYAKSAIVNNPAFVFSNTNTTASASVAAFIASASGGSTTNVSLENNGAGRLMFRTGATTEMGYGSARMTIDAAGLVGIGTASPTNLLHLLKAGSEATLTLESTGGSGQEYQIRSHNNGRLLFTNNSTSTNAIIIEPTSEVLFNKTITSTAALINGTQTTVSASGSGNVKFSQPEQGSTYKVVMVTCAAATGTAAYTFPVAFTVTPSVVGTNDAATGLVTTVSTTGVTITGAASTGSLMLIGY